MEVFFDFDVNNKSIEFPELDTWPDFIVPVGRHGSNPNIILKI